jgi:hypothetical protein
LRPAGESLIAGKGEKMAAFDTYGAFNARVPEKDRQAVKELQSLAWSELVAARSEEARLRVVENYIQEVRERLARQK